MNGLLAFPSLSRRQFLRHLGLATGGVVTTLLFDDLAALAAPAKGLRFVIVGAGLAGLCSAYELERRGHACILLESDTSHIGGRVRTLRFGEGLYGEAGARRRAGWRRCPTRNALPS